jgi:hypothetical protein
MNLLKKAADFARSPQGRKAIADARTKYDTPANRRRVTDALSRFRGGSARRPAAPQRPR